MRSDTPSTERGDRPGTPGTTRGNQRSSRDSDEDSDDTTLAQSKSLAAGSSSQQVTPVKEKEKQKEKKGMRYKLKQAFSIKSGLATTGLEVDGKGPVSGQVAQAALGRANNAADDDESSDEEAMENGRSASRNTFVPASTSTTNDDNASSRPPTSGRRFGMLNSKLNASTDNISMSSTVSSASVMIRKLGQIGKLARRSSMMSLTKAFGRKDKERDAIDEVRDDLATSQKKDKKKGAPSTASVSHAIAELESPTKAQGMSPAAALAKKHQEQYADQDAAVLSAASRLRSNPTAPDHQRSASTTSSMAASTSSSNGGRKWGFGTSRKDGTDSSVADSIRVGKDSLPPPQLGPSFTQIRASATFGTSAYDEDFQESIIFGNGDEFEPMSTGSPMPPKLIIKPSRSILKG
jgi:hypothetical protein